MSKRVDFTLFKLYLNFFKKEKEKKIKSLRHPGKRDTLHTEQER